MKNYQSIVIHEEGADEKEVGADISGGLEPTTFAFITKNAFVKNDDLDLSFVIDTNKSAYPQDHLVPPFDSEERPSNLFVGTFNLIATIIGGGVLSLPIVFAKCGIFFTTLAMILSAYMTYMTLIMLCFCSRRGGGSSYGEVVRSAFGETMEEGISWLLGVYLMFSIVAYMVLARDVWSPLVQQILGLDSIDGDYVLLTIVVFLLPFLFQRSLHALRKICYVGFASITILCIALCHGGWQNLKKSRSAVEDEQSNDSGDFNIQFFKIPSPQDLLFSFPIITCAFLCHFNVIAIQNALTNPTRERMQGLIRYVTVACFALMYAFGLGGYIFGGNSTQGNILLNIPMSKQGIDNSDYYLFLLGRIGCGLTIMLAMPLNLLPCREALLEVLDVYFHRAHHRSDHADNYAKEGEPCCWRTFHRYNSVEQLQDAEITTEDEIFEILSLAEGQSHQDDATDDQCRASAVLIRHDPIQSDYVFRNSIAHYGSTLLITIACYFIAVAVNGVATVWSFIGSSMGIFIAFILPSACFVVIESAVPTAAEGGDRKESWIKVAWAIMAFAIVGACVCTVNNTIGFGR